VGVRRSRAVEIDSTVLTCCVMAFGSSDRNLAFLPVSTILKDGAIVFERKLFTLFNLIFLVILLAEWWIIGR
jgi:hypothetical protein